MTLFVEGQVKVNGKKRHKKQVRLVPSNVYFLASVRVLVKL